MIDEKVSVIIMLWRAPMNSVQTDQLLNRMVGKREFYVQRTSLANLQTFPESLWTDVAS